MYLSTSFYKRITIIIQIVFNLLFISFSFFFRVHYIVYFLTFLPNFDIILITEDFPTNKHIIDKDLIYELRKKQTTQTCDVTQRRTNGFNLHTHDISIIFSYCTKQRGANKVSYDVEKIHECFKVIIFAIINHYLSSTFIKIITCIRFSLFKIFFFCIFIAYIYELHDNNDTGALI